MVRMLQGVKRSGTALSPTQGSPSTTEALQAGGAPTSPLLRATVEPANVLPFAQWSTAAELEYSSSESEGGEKAASFAVDMSTEPELTYSSSEHESEDETSGPLVAITAPSQSLMALPGLSVVAALAQEDSVCESVEQAEGSQTPEPKVEQENPAASSPSLKRKSPSSSSSSALKRARSSSSHLADITNGSTLQGHESKTLSPRLSASPNKNPFKAGRGRGCTGPGPAVQSPASEQPAVLERSKNKEAKKAAKTPATRKSSRLEEKMKKNE